MATPLTITSFATLSYGMAYSDTVSTLMHDSHEYALVLSTCILSILLLNAYYGLSPITNFFAMFMWLGLILFEYTHAYHTYFTSLFVICVLIWTLQIDNVVFATYWFTCTIIPVTIWVVMLMYGKNGWIPEYICLYVWIACWWYYMMVHIYDYDVLESCSSV